MANQVNHINLDTPYISMHEIQCRDPDNKVPVTAMQPELRNRLLILRDLAGGRPINYHSVYRTPKYNASLKDASPHSRHMYAEAADIDIEGLTPLEVAKLAVKAGFRGIGVYPTFTHVDVRPEEMLRPGQKFVYWGWIPEKRSTYQVIGTTHAILTDPENIMIKLLGDTLHGVGVTGINGSWFDIKRPTDLDRVWHVAVYDNKIIGNPWKMSGTGLSYKPPRGTIICTRGLKISVEMLQDITQHPEFKKKNILWAISGGSLMPLNLKAEGYNGFFSNIRRRANRTGIGYTKDGKVLLFVKPDASMERFNQTASWFKRNMGLEGAIFLDGGGSTQMNYSGHGIRSSRKIATAVLLKEVK